jgi:uncharacterized protein (DUF2342 family)
MIPKTVGYKKTIALTHNYQKVEFELSASAELEEGEKIGPSLASLRDKVQDQVELAKEEAASELISISGKK